MAHGTHKSLFRERRDCFGMCWASSEEMFRCNLYFSFGYQKRKVRENEFKHFFLIPEHFEIREIRDSQVPIKSSKLICFEIDLNFCRLVRYPQTKYSIDTRSKNDPP